GARSPPRGRRRRPAAHPGALPDRSRRAPSRQSREWVGHARSRSWPELPRRALLRPQLLEHAQLAQRVHALPEAFVPERHQLPVARCGFESVGFEARVVAREVTEEARLEHEKAAVDPTLADLRLLLELCDAVAVEDQPAAARRRTPPHDGRELAVPAGE